MKQVLVPFTTGVEEIEVVAIVDILRRADINVCMASLNGKPAIGRSNITIHADQHIQHALDKTWDLIVLPGGLPNAQLLQEDKMLQHIVCKHAKQGKAVAAICAAPVALAAWGLTKGKHITSYPSFQKDMLTLQPESTYMDDAVVEGEGIITSRGAGTAITFALRLVTHLCGQDKADEIHHAIVA